MAKTAWNIILLAFLCLLLERVVSDNPGLKFRVSQKGLNYGASVAVNILSGSVNKVVIPNQSGSVQIAFGDIAWQATNIKITSFTKPSTSVTVNPGSGLTWTLTNAGTSVHGDWSYQYTSFLFGGSDSGTFDANATGISVSVSLVLGKNASGYPTIASTACSCSVNSLSISLHGGASWLYDLLIGYFTTPVNNALQGTICKLARAAIDENAKQQLATLPVQTVVENNWLLDYRLVAAPVFAAGYIESSHKGECFLKTDTSEAPFQPDTFASSTADQMLTLWISDYTLNTVGYVLYKSNLIRYNLTKNDLPASSRGILNTTCSSGTCIGNLVPQISQKFPNAFVEIQMGLSTRPTATILNSALSGNIVGNIIVRARLANGSLANLIAANVTLQLSVNVTLENLILKGKVNTFLFDITVTDSKVGSISNSTMKTILSLSGNPFIISKLNEVGSTQGIPLPLVSGVRFNNTKLVFDPHSLRIITDVQYP